MEIKNIESIVNKILVMFDDENNTYLVSTV